MSNQSDNLSYCFLFVLLFQIYSTSCLSLGELRIVLDVLDVSHITQYLVHDKSSSISQLTKGKVRDIQKLL